MSGATVDEIKSQLTAFSESVKTALAKFNGQDELVKALSDRLAALEKSVAELGVTATLATYPEATGFTDVKQAKEFVSMVRSIFVKDDARAKTMTESIDPDGGYLIQPEYRNSLISVIQKYGIARQRCTVIPMKGTELIMPRLTGGVQVYWVGEGQTIDPTKPSFGDFRISIKKMAALVPMTNELLADETIANANLLSLLFGQAIAKEEDRIVFVGNMGAGDPFNGVLYDAGVRTFTLESTKTHFTDITADHLSDVTASLPAIMADGAQFYFHRTILNVLRKLKDTTGNYIWAQPTADGQPGTIWGYPYTLCDLMPSVTETAAASPFMFFGNLQHYYIGDRQQMTIARSEHVGFAQDKTFLRVLQREGMQYALPETGVVIKTAAS